MDFLGDLFGGLAEGLAICFSGNGKNDGGGCVIFIVVIAIIGGVGMGISSCQKKTEVPPAPIIQKQQEAVKQEAVKQKETMSHWLGRKSKDSVIEFGKGVIGK